MRNTKQRDAVLEALRATKEHPSAEMLYLKLKETMPAISLATVYRNLRTLCALGEARELEMEPSSRFDADMSEHYHFLCDKCHNVTDIFAPCRPGVVDAAKKRGCRVDGYDISMHGVCALCMGK